MTRYELVERIGAGGMAEIFRGRAIAAGGFEKPVAIKRILPHLSQDKRFVELLIAEAHILAHLRHRNIVQIFDVGLGPDGQYFLVMEYVDGADLRCIQDGLEASDERMSMDLGLYIGAEICDALEQAHTAPGPDGKPMRLVHRDVSPSNILLSRSGEVKLTDFGIAKRPEDVTGHGTVRGKFAYISPEQAFNAHVDARSDVFSAGIVLFELLLGRRLFSQMPDFDALRAVRSAEVPRPAKLQPGIDPRLDRLLMKALAKNPDDRFKSAGELARELREVRYSMPASDADPVQELASLVERYTRPEPEKPAKKQEFEEATVVRINTSHGFSLSSDYEDDKHKSYVDARMIVSSFEEEVTRAMAFDPALAAVDDPDFPDDDADPRAPAARPGLTPKRTSHNTEEATVVGSMAALKRRRSTALDERPTGPLPGRESAAVAGELSRNQAEWAGELGAGASPAAGSADGAGSESIDGPTLDRSFALDSDPVPDRPVPGMSENVAMPTATAAVSLYAAPYAPYSAEDLARRRRKNLLVGIGVGTGLLLLLLFVGLLGDSHEAASQAGVITDAGATDAVMDAGVDAGPIPDATVDAAVDAAVPKKKPPRKRPKKKSSKKKKSSTTKKKSSTKKTTKKKTTSK